MRALVLLLVLAAAATADESIRVRLEPASSRSARPRISFPQTRFPLLERPPEGIAVEGLSPEARYGVVKLGGRRFPLAFDAPEGSTALGLLYPGAGDPKMGRAHRSDATGFRVDFNDVECDGLHLNVGLIYRGTAVAGVAEPARHRRGRVSFAGATREVLLIDGDADGAYNGKADRWISLRQSRAARTARLRRVEAHLLAEPQVPFDAEGRALMVEQVAADGSSLVLRRGAPRMTLAEVLGRRDREVRAQHFARFRHEKKDFVRRYELGGRPAARKTPAWRTTTLAEARAAASRDGRPILVHFVSETNPWCYRYDFYTFRDAQVAKLLRVFHLVRIDIEKDAAGDYRNSGARGIPTLQPFDSSGEPITFRLLTRDAKGKRTDLEKPERMITGWQRPHELTINLERILAAR